jgi:hypothetical protein
MSLGDGTVKMVGDIIVNQTNEEVQGSVAVLCPGRG